jgi:hypothetical protein
MAPPPVIINLKSIETIAATYEANCDFLSDRQIKTLEKLHEVLKWILPTVPWPASTQMGHARRDRFMHLSAGFSVDFAAQTLKGYMISLQSSYVDDKADNDFYLLKLPPAGRKKYAAMYGLVRPFSKDRDFVVGALRDSLAPSGGVHVESLTWSKLSAVFPDIFFVSITVSTPRDYYKAAGACRSIVDAVLLKLYGKPGDEPSLIVEYEDETTIRSDATSGGEYWYINGCRPHLPTAPLIVCDPSNPSIHVISDAPIVTNADFMLVDLEKQRRLLKRIVDSRSTAVTTSFNQFAIIGSTPLDNVMNNGALIQHRLQTISYSNSRNESLRRAHDDVLKYHPHAQFMMDTYNLMISPVVMIDNSADPDLSSLSFDAFCKYHTDCGIRSIDVTFKEPRRVADLALYLAGRNEGFDDKQHVVVDVAKKIFTFTVDDD